MKLRLLFAFCLWIAFAGSLSATETPTLIDQTFDRMYRHNFDGAQAVIKEHIDLHPQDPLGYSVRSAVYLFRELDRLQILEAEFFGDDNRIMEKKEAKPDPAIRAGVFDSIAKARDLTTAILAKDPNDVNALLAMCIATGIQTDYMALIEKRQLGSLSVAKESHNWALRLLKIDSHFYDAYLTTGVSEYLLGSLPFFVKWFVKFDDAKGSKQQAQKNLELVAKQGRYFRPFAKVLLAMIHLREKRPRAAEIQLAELNREFPENPLFRKELQKLRNKESLVPGRGD